MANPRRESARDDWFAFGCAVLIGAVLIALGLGSYFETMSR